MDQQVPPIAQGLQVSPHRRPVPIRRLGQGRLPHRCHAVRASRGRDVDRRNLGLGGQSRVSQQANRYAHKPPGRPFVFLEAFCP